MKHRKRLTAFLAILLAASLLMPSNAVVRASEPSAPAGLEEPGAGETPTGPEEPGTGETPAGPEKPGEGETPAGPEAPEEGETPAGPEAPEEGETPAGPETPEAGETPAGPEAPEAGETPAGPEAPEAGETPAGPEAPGAGETPAGPEEPGEGETPAGPEEPGAGETPAGPEEPGAGETPAGPEEPGAGETPAGPEEPGAGETPAGPEESGEAPSISPMSLLPLKEVEAYMVINNYSEEQLKAMPVSEVLGLLRDSKGNKIEIPETATTVWSFLKDEDGDIIEDGFHELGSGDTIDLFYYHYSDYTMELIVGSKNQLDPDNIRYIVKVYHSKEIDEEIIWELYKENGGYRNSVYSSRYYDAVKDIKIQYDAGLDLTVQTVTGELSSHTAGTEYYLGIESKADDRPDIDADIYTLEEFQKFRAGQGGTPITDQILDQDLFELGTGYKGVYDAPQDPAGRKLFCIVYKDPDTGRTVGWRGLEFIVVQKAETISFTGDLYHYDGQKMIKITSNKEEHIRAQDSWTIDKETGAVSQENISNGCYYEIQEGYERDAEYYYVLTAQDGSGADMSSHVVKAVEGFYHSLEEAAEEPDIKDQLFASGQAGAPYGYKKNYSSLWTDFTVFLDQGRPARRFFVEIEDDTAESANTWFRVNGAKQDGQDIASVSLNMSDDTYGDYGYQTVLLHDADADLSRLQPKFSVENDKVSVYAGSKQESGVSVQDFSKGPVQYEVLAEGKPVRNYWVTFSKKASGAKLFVNGPAEREVLLNENYEYMHDILIANLGDQPLTGLKVKLDATHVRLDDYWTVGGNGNDTLAAFTEDGDRTPDGEYARYGEWANLAKIRLLPEGSGAIDGTLTISADGQQDVVIRLKGYASNPYIVTDGLDEAVKYVPYSFVVATNNKYEWNEVKFSLTSGRLPEGLSLSPLTGEIYGVPREAGEFPIRVEAEYSSSQFRPYYADLTLTVKENTSANVYQSSDKGYELLEAIGQQLEGEGVFELQSSGDQLFVSNGEFGEFMDLWLNGEKLIEGEDYTKESGSTRITVKSQTFTDKAVSGAENTIAAEFREDGDVNKDLRRTAQNFRLNIKDGGGSHDDDDEDGGASGSGGGAAGAAGASAGGAEGAAQSPYVTFIVRVADAANQPMAGVTVELHSAPKTGQTDANGYVRFEQVEFGSHTLTVKDAAGKVLASRQFELLPGSGLAMNGDQITVKGGTAVSLMVKVENGTLSFTTAVLTGDDTNLLLWLVLALAAASAASGIWFHYRRRNRNI